MNIFPESHAGVGVAPSTRIVGGTPTTIDQFPYQVSVMYIDTHICGGSLIHPLYVLTAAHCTNTFPSILLLVRAGSTYIDQNGQVRQVIQISQHPNYNEDTWNNDISVLKLVRPFDVPNVHTVQLPPKGAALIDNKIGVATGWGRLSEDGARPMELQKVELPIISTATCNSPLVYGNQITEKMFCAGYLQGGKDSCEGDSGGPFVVEGQLLGITSWGYGCARPNKPGVYTKVSMFVDYINQIIS